MAGKLKGDFGRGRWRQMILAALQAGQGPNFGPDSPMSDSPHSPSSQVREIYRRAVAAGKTVVVVAMGASRPKAFRFRVGDEAAEHLLHETQRELNTWPAAEVHCQLVEERFVAVCIDADFQMAEQEALIRILNLSEICDPAARTAAGLARTKPGSPVALETLIQVALEGLDVAQAGGGLRAVHTELYELFQSKHLRENPQWTAPQPEPIAPPAETQAEAEPNTEDEPQAESEAQATTTVVETEVTGEQPEAALPNNPLNAGSLDTLKEHLPPIRTELIDAIEERAQVIDPGATDFRRQRRELIEEAVRMARLEWESSSSQALEQHHQQVDNLQRRIEKLRNELNDTERELKLAKVHGGYDDGVPSIYRNAAGLLDTDAQYELKRDLMGMIFRSNLDLRRHLRHLG